MSAEPAVDQDELARQVQRLAGRAFLHCLHLEEGLKSLLSVMTVMGVGNLKPADAAGILNGDRKLTSGQARSDILRHLDSERNFAQPIDLGVTARNEIIHHIHFSRWMVNDTAELQQLATTVKELTKRIAVATDAIRLVARALIEVLFREHPHLCTPEMRNQLAQVPWAGRIEITEIHS